MEPILVDYYEYRDSDGICVLGCKHVLPDGTVVIHGEEPQDEALWRTVEEPGYYEVSQK